MLNNYINKYCVCKVKFVRLCVRAIKNAKVDDFTWVLYNACEVKICTMLS